MDQTGTLEFGTSRLAPGLGGHRLTAPAERSNPCERPGDREGWVRRCAHVQQTAGLATGLAAGQLPLPLYERDLRDSGACRSASCRRSRD